MSRKIEVVYENGVLRPLEPLEVEEGKPLAVTLEESSGVETTLLVPCREFSRGRGERPVSLEEVRQGLSAISGQMSDEVTEERKESR